MKSLEQLRRIAQDLANDSGKPRWIIWTSLGWRIEWNEPRSWLCEPVYRIDPEPLT